jgi:hypothetical protein
MSAAQYPDPDAWRGNDRRRSRWFRACITPIIARALSGVQPWVQERLIDWLTDHQDDYLRWVPEEFYRGSGYSCGGWCLVGEKQLLEGAQRALTEIARQVERDRYPTLDTFLAALARGEDHLPAAPAEPGAVYLVDDLQAFRAAQRRRKLRNHHCRGCGGPLPPTDLKLKWCDRCYEARRAPIEAREAEKVAARALGARYLAALLDKAGVDPLDFPEGQRYLLVTRAEVAGWLAGENKPSQPALRVMAETHWHLEAEALRLAGWAFWPSRNWPEQLRPRIVEALTAAGLLPPPPMEEHTHARRRAEP